jgi:DNA-directed RNA polymerase specialized sigma24 family protein
VTPTTDAATATDRADLAAALAREPAAARRLVARIAPAIRRRIAAALDRRGRPRGPAWEAELLDLTQEVLLLLFEADGRVLRTWDPARGASLPTFCGLVAERATVSILRSGRRGAWREDPTEDAALDRVAPPALGPGPVVEDRDFLAALLDRLRSALNPRGLSLFQAIYVDELPLEVVAERHAMTVEAVYVWRSRARKLMQTLRDELLAENADPRDRLNAAAANRPPEARPPR